jgi:hypothetical protein
MATRSEEAKASSEKKGVAKKRAKKLSQRKASKTNRTGPAAKKAPRTKRDTEAVIAHEVAASTPEARASRAKAKGKSSRVRGKA